ncbi:MAG: hypothetical protein JSV84_12145, partial [Gemmatimonadota bacterium]
MKWKKMGSHLDFILTVSVVLFSFTIFTQNIEVFSQSLDLEGAGYISYQAVMVADVDNDGQDELLVATSQGFEGLPPPTTGGGVIIYEYTTSPRGITYMPVWSTTFPGEAYEVAFDVG